jgi:hypothetical protein
MKIQIGKLYTRCKPYLHEDDVVVVTGKRRVKHEVLIEFFYLDEPDEHCTWNTAAFKDGMNELNAETGF